MRRRRARRGRHRRWLARAAAWPRVRQAARAIALRPRATTFFLLAAGMFFTVGPLLRYCRDHRYFAVRAVEVQGLERLDAARVRMWLGMVEGSSIWAAAPRELEARLEAQPAIARARVRRVLPDRIQVLIKERTPSARLRVGERSYLVDRSGVVIGDAPLGGADLLIITAPEAGRSTLSARELRHAVQLARLLEVGSAGVAVSEISLEPSPNGGPHWDLVAFSSDGRLAIRLGWGGWRAKLDAVRRVLAHVARGGAASSQTDPARDGIAVGRLAGTLDARDAEGVVARWGGGGA